MRLGSGPLYGVAVRSCLGLVVHVTPGGGGGGGGEWVLGGHWCMMRCGFSQLSMQHQGTVGCMVQGISYPRCVC